MVSQAELYEYLHKSGKRYNTQELIEILGDRFVRKKLNQLYRFGMVHKKETNIKARGRNMLLWWAR